MQDDNQGMLGFEEPKPPVEKSASEEAKKSAYEELAAELGESGLKVIEEVVEVAEVTESLFYGHSEPFKEALAAAIRNRKVELSVIWSDLHLDEKQVAERALIAAGKLAAHSKGVNRENQAAVRRKSRRDAIRRGDISAKFPPGFCPPPRFQSA